VFKFCQSENNVGMDIIFLNIFLVFLFEIRRSSKYVGVSWDKRRKKWVAKIKDSYIGGFEIEKDAAKAINVKCQELNIPLKNPGVGVLNHEKLKKLKEKLKKVIFCLIFFNWFLF
jgi:hypothetical protein